MIKLEYELGSKGDKYMKDLEVVKQREFLEKYVGGDIEKYLTDNTDGIIKGVLVEFKLVINNINSVLFQCIKYLSNLRIKGKPVPANIILVDLESKICWKYKSEDFRKEIEKVYFGRPSEGNEDWYTEIEPIDKWNYEKDSFKTCKSFQDDTYFKVNLDENCILGWAKHYYGVNKKFTKKSFLGENGEIRKPKVLKDYILPYTKESNKSFEYLMDRLNNSINKKALGAFYTPPIYADKSHELLYKAIERVPQGYDYIILDRCAGTGNLEESLPLEILKHCVLSTLEYYEYKILVEKFSDKVRSILNMSDCVYENGRVKNCDATTDLFYQNTELQEYLKDEKCVIIIYENVPFSEATGVEYHKKRDEIKYDWKHNTVVEEMRNKTNAVCSKDLGNVFIWSGFQMLRKEYDSYLVFSPIKYWKGQKLISKKFIGGYLFNRKHFHTTTDAGVACILWGMQEDKKCKEIKLECYDIENNRLKPDGEITVPQIKHTYSKKYYKSQILETDKKDGILCEFDGTESRKQKYLDKGYKLYNENIIGFLSVESTTFENPDMICTLLRGARYNTKGTILRKDNYLEQLPMFCAGRLIRYQPSYKTRSVIMKSADGYERKLPENYLYKCLIFTCLEPQNHILEFTGTDGRVYKNELSLTEGTLATKDLEANYELDEEDKKLISQWNRVLEQAKKTKEYDKDYHYTPYSLSKYVDLSYKNEDNIPVYLNKEVHTELVRLKQAIKEYYLQEILPTLYEHEYLK